MRSRLPWISITGCVFGMRESRERVSTSAMAATCRPMICCGRLRRDNDQISAASPRRGDCYSRHGKNSFYPLLHEFLVLLAGFNPFWEVLQLGHLCRHELDALKSVLDPGRAAWGKQSQWTKLQFSESSSGYFKKQTLTLGPSHQAGNRHVEAWSW